MWNTLDHSVSWSPFKHLVWQMTSEESILHKGEGLCFGHGIDYYSVIDSLTLKERLTNVPRVGTVAIVNGLIEK